MRYHTYDYTFLISAFALLFIKRDFVRVKSSKFGHQVNSDTRLQTVEIQMRRLLMSRLIRIFTVCVSYFLFQLLNCETNEVAARI